MESISYLKKTDLAKKSQTAKLTSEKSVSSVYDKFGLSDNDSSEYEGSKICSYLEISRIDLEELILMGRRVAIE